MAGIDGTVTMTDTEYSEALARAEEEALTDAADVLFEVVRRKVEDGYWVGEWYVLRQGDMDTHRRMNNDMRHELAIYSQAFGAMGFNLRWSCEHRHGGRVAEVTLGCGKSVRERIGCELPEYLTGRFA